MFLSLVLIVLWFILLIKGADFLVDGASSLAKKLHISDLVIGLTIVAFGTSAPELVVNVIGSVNDANDMVLGNIIWSNIANILLILWITASIKALTISRSTTWKEIPFALLWALVLAVMINDELFARTSTSSLSLADGIVLLCFFIIFMYYTVEIVRSRPDETQEEIINPLPSRQSTLMVIGWIAGLARWGNMVVNNATILATMRWRSEKLIGLTILAIGTSLPELATSIVAVTKSKANIAVGNIVWSNIFNVFFVLGITAIVSPVAFNSANNLDILINLIVHILFFAVLFIDKRRTLQRWQGVVFVILYLAFLWGMFWLG
jgi:cation:H+ antiporter